MINTKNSMKIKELAIQDKDTIKSLLKLKMVPVYIVTVIVGLVYFMILYKVSLSPSNSRTGVFLLVIGLVMLLFVSVTFFKLAFTLCLDLLKNEKWCFDDIVQDKLQTKDKSPSTYSTGYGARPISANRYKVKIADKTFKVGEDFYNSLEVGKKVRFEMSRFSKTILSNIELS